MRNKKVTQMERDIILEWWYPRGPEEVWECLTNAEILSEWFMKNDFKPVVGHKFQFRSKPIPVFNWDGIVYGTVLEIVPLKKIVYRWQGGAAPGKVHLDTTVAWILKEKDNGTQLRLEHRGFKGMKNLFARLIMEKGWKKLGTKRLVKTLEKLSNGQI